MILKSLTNMVFRRYPWRLWRAGRINRRAHQKLGDGTDSSAVMSVLNWITSTFPEAPPMMWRVLDDATEEKEAKHAILRLLTRPNEFYSGEDLWNATLLDYHATGDAYWFKIRRRNSAEVAELWWCPSFMLEPVGSEGELITHYVYKPDGQEIRIEREDVIHFRYGIDPEDQKHGRAPLKTVLREVLTDEEASQFTTSLLVNMGVPGLIVAPDIKEFRPSDDDVKATKELLRTQFSGDSRGEPLVMSGPTKVTQFGFSPAQMDLKVLRRIPEERISGVLGVPAIVAGLGAGLDRSTFANFAEAREAGYESKIIPLQRSLSSVVRFQLLPDFEEDPWDWRFGFDISVVRVLQEDEDAKAQRMVALVNGGIATVGEGRRAVGLEAGPEHNYFLRPVALVAVPADDQLQELAPPAPDPLQLPPGEEEEEPEEVEAEVEGGDDETEPPSD